MNATMLNGIHASEFITKAQLRSVAVINDNGEITHIDGSKLTNKINKSCLPDEAFIRCVTVETDALRYKLTKTDVQNGDLVKVSGTSKTYMVSDDSKLTTDAGYTELVAATAASVAWSGVTSKPTTIAGYGLTNEVQQKINTRAPKYTYGTSELTPGTSTLESGTIYFMYE